MKEKNADCILDIYKMFVNTTQHTSECRQRSNNFYILLNSGIVAYNSQFHSLFIIVFGILINSVWLFKIQSYTNLNKAKFQVINKIEKKLPLQVFADEYTFLKKIKHKNLSYYERYIPIIFLIIYSIVLLDKYGEQFFYYLITYTV
ncbi:RipA family octameric membrane protein [Candidatus Avelusimicrobium fimicolum]|uniref:RipA family octameric membrane protein n=1 Tax=Candidatus Avelusimicrobium fimicolum TaxID=3416216 RepID=UPI0015B355BD